VAADAGADQFERGRNKRAGQPAKDRVGGRQVQPDQVVFVRAADDAFRRGPVRFDMADIVAGRCGEVSPVLASAVDRRAAPQ
jgi:hypothetical protein